MNNVEFLPAPCGDSPGHPRQDAVDPTGLGHRRPQADFQVQRALKSPVAKPTRVSPTVLRPKGDCTRFLDLLLQPSASPGMPGVSMAQAVKLSPGHTATPNWTWLALARTLEPALWAAKASAIATPPPSLPQRPRRNLPEAVAMPTSWGPTRAGGGPADTSSQPSKALTAREVAPPRPHDRQDLPSCTWSRPRVATMPTRKHAANHKPRFAKSYPASAIGTSESILAAPPSRGGSPHEPPARQPQPLQQRRQRPQRKRQQPLQRESHPAPCCSNVHIPASLRKKRPLHPAAARWPDALLVLKAMLSQSPLRRVRQLEPRKASPVCAP